MCLNKNIINNKKSKNSKINNFLKELKEFWLKENIPNISELNARFIRDIIKISKTKKILEIWTANGYSTIHMADELVLNNLNNLKNLEITTLDRSLPTYQMSIKNFKEVWFDNIINPIFEDAITAIPKLDNNYYDLCFCDAMKRKTHEFVKLALPKIKTWWIIIVDDVIKFKNKMKDFYIFLEENKIKHTILKIDEDDWVCFFVKE